MAVKGRPRKFEESYVLERAMLLFWAQGYEGTSMAQLRESTGLSSASLYNSFGTKEQLFEQAVGHYVSLPGSVVSLTSNTENDARSTAHDLLHKTVDEQMNPAHPLGCMIALSATVGPSDESAKPTEVVKKQRDLDQQCIRSLVERGIDEGALSEEAPVSALTILMHTFVLGLATQVIDGVRAEDLHATADAIMATWDSYAPRVPAH